jgi:hypothetical protein
MSDALTTTCETIENALAGSPSFRQLGNDLYIVKQGSAYVMIHVIPWGEGQDRAIVRCVAQMVTGIDMDGGLALKLLAMNGVLRFGTFAYVPEERVLLFGHSILGGTTLDADELLTTLADVALIADDWDDRIIAEYGGRTMEEVITDEALKRIARSLEDEDTTWDNLTTEGLIAPT